MTPDDEIVQEPKKKQFHFKTFSERLKDINVDAIHRVRQIQPSSDSEDASKVAECLAKWKSLDLTEQFKYFYQKVFKKCQSYKMVVYYQQDIIKSLLHYLSKEDTLALESLLEVLVSLSADLGPDFYSSFFVFFPILTKLLKTRDTQKLEWIFVTISLLFRNLWRYMVKDMENVLDLYKTLLTSDQPSHIATFAAESVSFLLRKSKNHKQVLKKLFSILKDHPKATDSISQVLFQMFKSSQNQFHSITASTVPLMLRFAGQPYITESFYDATCKCIEATLQLMAQHAKKQHAGPVWKSIVLEIQNSTGKSKDFTYVNHLINFLNVWCKTQRGSKLVSDKDLIDSFNHCVTLLESSVEENILQLYSSLCDLASTVIIAKKVEICLEDKKNILLTLMSSVTSLDCAIHLWNSIMKSPDFLNNYMTLFLKFCQNQIQHQQHQPRIVHLLVTYALINQRLPQDNIELLHFKPRILDFSFFCSKANVSIGSIVKDIISHSTDWDKVWYSLVACLSIRPIHKSLKSCLLKLMHQFFDCNDLTNEKVAVLSMAVLVCYKLFGAEAFEDFPFQLFFSLLIRKPHSKHLLFILDVLTANHTSSYTQITDDQQNKLVSLFEKNLSSCDAVLRRLTLSVLQHIDVNNSLVYKSCLVTEDIPASLQTIREKVLKLNKLLSFKEIKCCERTKVNVIRFIFSNFFVNFAPLWEPVQNILCSCAAANEKDVFWRILFELLEDAPIRQENSIAPEKLGDEECAFDDQLFQSVLHGYIKPKNYACNERVNFSNYRLLLWKTLLVLPNLRGIQAHSKQLVNMFLQFLKNEFFHVDKHLDSYEAIQNDDSVAASFDVVNIKKSQTVTLLSTILKVFGRFSNLQGFSQADYLHRVFKDFMMHPDSNLQMLAFKCMLAFNDSTLVKYKDVLISFMDETKFRHAIVDFNFNDMAEDDRSVIMPMLLQILFGKMKSKEKMHNAGKAAPSTRRAMIVRFLSNISKSEMTVFAEMLWRPYAQYLEATGLSECFNTDNLQQKGVIKLIPVRKQHGILNCIDLLIEECSQQLTDDTFTTLITLLLQINAINKIIMDKRSNSNNSAQSSKIFFALQGVKRQSFECILDMLKSYPAVLPTLAVEALFSIHIWPGLPKLLHESSGKPNMLLKLLFLFAEKTSFVVFLAKINPLYLTSENFDCSSPLAALTSLLISPKCSSDVITYIIELLLCMLYGSNSEENEMLIDSADDFSRQVTESFAASGKLSVELQTQNIKTRLQLGLALIKPYLHRVLQYFIQKMKRNKKGFLLPDKHLKFLSAIGERVTDSALLDDLTELLLGHVCSASSRSSEEDDPFTLSLRTLAQVMRNPKHILLISKLFGKLTVRTHRLALVSILKSACKNDPEFKWTCEIVSGLNAWEKTSVDQMDYDAKLLAFRNVSDHLKSDDFDSIFERNCKLFLPILHCCLFTLTTSYADISLRDSVHYVLELTIKRIHDLFLINFDYAFQAYQVLIQQLILPSIQSGLDSPVDDMRHDNIKMLSHVVAYFPNEPSLVGLDVFRNETNIEDDTFDNLRHIQMHRRANAFRKVATVLKKQHFPPLPKEKPHKDGGEMEVKERIATMPKGCNIISVETIKKYILPIVMQNLLNHRFKHIPYVREACIDVLKVASSIVPWSMYKKMLVKCLTSIKFPITSFQIICGLLEVFPFDLSDYKWKGSKAASAEKTITQDFLISNDNEKDKSKADANRSKVLKRNKLSAAEADAVLNDVTRVILPNIYKILSVQDIKNPKQSKPDITYRSCERRLPYAKPVVLLLKKLPQSILQNSLPTVVLNIFAFLKHKDYEVRTAASKATVNTLRLLGSAYFPLMLKHLKVTLCRGFQRQVLLHTLHLMLKCLSSNAKIGMFDDSLPLLLEIVVDGLFESLAEDKEKLKEKLPEASGSNKAYLMCTKIARYIRKSDLTTLLQPFKGKLQETHCHNVTKIACNALNKIVEGLLLNSDFEVKDLLVFVHGLISENASNLFAEKQSNTSKKGTDSSGRAESCYILFEKPKRYGEKTVAKSSSTNQHILIEFGLNLLLGLLKKMENIASNQHFQEMLDPLLPELTICLKSKHVRTVSCTVDCITYLYQAKLPSMPVHAKVVVDTLFKIAGENSKGMGNQMLALSCFKSLRILCHSDYGQHISVTQLKVLLAYAEEDLYNSDRQIQSFTLIRSIISRGFQGQEVISIIVKVRDIAIQSQTKFIQEQARMLYLYFLKNYPMFPNVLDEHIQFILTHLTYEYEDGRMSALQLISTIATTFPEQLLNENAGVLFVPTAAVMINDSSSICRESAAAVIKFLLPRLKQETSDQLFSFVMQW